MVGGKKCVIINGKATYKATSADLKKYNWISVPNDMVVDRSCGRLFFLGKEGRNYFTNNKDTYNKSDLSNVLVIEF